ncbi:hypothetical protein M9458_033642, partial [Cirrhinus mrigala]
MLNDSIPDKHVGHFSSHASVSRSLTDLVPKTSPQTPSLVNHRQTSQPTPKPILPPNLIVSPIIWNLDQDIQQANLQEPAPQECPEGKIYVPRSQCQDLLGTAHQSPGPGHPGTKQTLSLLQTHYWWPGMRRDTIRYVQSCSVCAMSNSPRMLPTGKLVPLPIPERPWSHLGVDFVRDLPSSEGSTCAGNCRPFLQGMQVHSSEGIADCHGDCGTSLPSGVPSLRHPGGNGVGLGPSIHFTCLESFKLLGVTVNLSSGYHPQTNGQTERKIQELGRNLWRTVAKTNT